MIGRGMMLMAVCMPVYLMAQTRAVAENGSIAGIHFWTAFIGGVLIAYGFQMVLTGLSGGIGVSALGAVTKPKRREERGAKREAAESEEAWSQTAIKVENGAGAWALITTSIALFFAAWLAVAIAGPIGLLPGIVLGLVIWSTFFLVMLLFQGWLANSVLGSILSTATMTFKSTFGAIRDMMERRMARRDMVQSAEQITEAVRHEIMEGFDAEGIKRKIEEYVTRLQPPGPADEAGPSREGGRGQMAAMMASRVKPPDMKGMSAKIMELLDDKELVSAVKERNVHLSKDDIVNILSRHTSIGKDRIDSIANTFLSAWNSLLGTVGQAREQTQQKAGDVGQRYQEFKRRLQNTKRSELDPDRIEQEIKLLLSNPAEGIAALRRHSREIDRDSVEQVLRERRDLSDDEARRMADQIVSRYEKALEQYEAVSGKVQEAKNAVLQKIQAFFDSFTAPELDYQGIRSDVRKLFEDPKAGFDALRTRLMGIDRQTLITVLESNKNISRDDAERMVASIESARDDVLRQAEHIRDITARRIEDARIKAMEQADEARKVAATAAWWLFIILVVSGAAAAVGGMVGAATVL